MRKKIKKILTDAILNATQYSGEKRTGQKVLSASSINGDNLQWVLKYRHGMVDDDKVSQSSIGSLLHLGMEYSLERDDHTVSVEQRLEMDLSNGFVISGAFDGVIEVEPGVYSIVDHKTINHSVLKKLDKEGKDSDYAIQQRIYKHLLIMKEPEKYNRENLHMCLNLLIKDGKPHQGIPDHELYMIEDEWTDVEIEMMFEDKIQSLLPYIEDDKLMPEDCENKFWAKTKGESKARPLKCIHWCSVSEHCPWFKSYSKNIEYSNKKAGNNALKSMIAKSKEKHKDIRI